VTTAWEGLRCDFCNVLLVREQTTFYPAKKFEMLRVYSGEKILRHGSDQGWAACDDCDSFVGIADWQGLVERVMHQHDFGLSDIEIKEMKERLIQGWEAFHENRSDPAYRPDAKDWEYWYQKVRIGNMVLEAGYRWIEEEDSLSEPSPKTVAEMREAHHHRWLQALEVKYDLLAWWRSPRGYDFTEYCLNNFGSTDWRNKWSAEKLIGISSGHVEHGQPYWVSKDMVQLLMQVAPRIEVQELLPTDLPTPTGFVLFEEPIIVKDFRGAEINMHILAWGPANTKAGPGVSLSLYSDIDSMDPYGTPYAMRELWGWEYGVLEMEPAMMAFWKLMSAMWTLMQQRIAVNTKGPMNKKTAKRLARRGIDPYAIPQVQVITLRRTSVQSDHSIHREVEWSHRWLVDAHWRKQWYPSIQGHRQILILPYMKGPADKPIVTKEKVIQWVR